jgi:WD40 repeat protein
MFTEYFNSKSIRSKEPDLKYFERPVGDIIRIWNSPQGWRSITRNEDKTYTLWNLEKVQPISSFGDTGKIDEIFTRNYKYDQHVVEPFGHRSEITDFAITSDEKIAVTALKDSTCITWDVQNNKPVIRLVGFSTGASPIAITPDGKRMIMSQKDPFWDE